MLGGVCPMAGGGAGKTYPPPEIFEIEMGMEA